MMNIELRNVHFSYTKRKILDNITFSAHSGDFLFILGPNGVGKSTLFRCILRLIKDYDGDILIAGKNTKQMSIEELAKNIAYIPQSHYPAFNFSVLNSVLMGFTVHLKRYESPGAGHEARAMKALEMLGISHLWDRGYSEISGGERQLALIARAIVQNAKILVMDEPTANLDYGNQVHVMRQVRKLSKQGYIVILSTHNPEHALLYGKKVLVLNDGRILKFGNPKEVLTESLLKQVFQVHVQLNDISTDYGQVRVIVPNHLLEI